MAEWRNGGMAGMAVRQKEWQNSRMAEMATYVLFTVPTDDDDDADNTLIFYSIESSVMVRYSLPLIKGDRLSFSSHLKCHQEATH